MTKLQSYGICGNYCNYGNFDNLDKFLREKRMIKRYNRRNNKGKRLISAKEIMNRYNISYQTINHYTDFGVLTVYAKNGNVRFYDRGLVGKRLKKIRQLVEEGYSLRLIRKKLIGI